MSARSAELEAALAECYPFARSLALMLARNAHHAEDLVQEAMAAAWRSPPGVVNAATVRAWLRTAITRELFRRSRRALSEFRALGRLFLEPPPSPAPTQLSHDLLSVLRRLPPRQRACIVLRYVHDLTEEQVATELGMAPGTVKAHLAQGRARLRTLLGE